MRRVERGHEESQANGGRRFADKVDWWQVVAVSVLLLVVTLLSGCEPATNAVDDEAFQRAYAEAVVAFAEAEVERDRPVTPVTTCDACDGMGTVLSGDGLARVPCECGSACRCERTSVGNDASRSRERRARLLYFSAKWCLHCRANEETFAKLAARGWQIGTGPENHIQTIDVDDCPELQSEHGVTAVPTWIFIENGVERRRCTGPLDPFEVGRMFEE